MYTKELIDEIGANFADPKNPNLIDLNKLRQFVSKDPNVSESQVFVKKLRDLSSQSTISKGDFEKHFMPDVTNVPSYLIQETHFNYVFNLIDTDGSGKISKRELELLNKEQGLNLTANEIQMMINIASRDKQKVFKEDLFKFLNSQ